MEKRFCGVLAGDWTIESSLGRSLTLSSTERDGLKLLGRRRFVVSALSIVAPAPLLSACGGGEDPEGTESLPLSASDSPVANAGQVTTTAPVPAPSVSAPPSPPPPTVAPAPPGPLPAPKALRAALPSWVPAPGQVVVLTQSNGLLTNTFRSTVAPYYSDYVSVNTVNAFSGSVVNPYYGAYGAIVFEGGGHADSNDNSVHVLELGASQCSFRRVTDPTPLFGYGADDATRIANSRSSAEVRPLTDLEWAEYTVDGQPTSRHSYGAQDVIGPEHGGAAAGTFMRVMVNSGAVHGEAGGEVAHKVDFTATSGTMRWERAADSHGVTGPNNAPGRGARVGPPNWTAHVPAQRRIYMECQGRGSSMVPRWFDLRSRTFVDGIGLKRVNDQDSPDCGTMFHVEWRDILVFADVHRGLLRLRYMNVAVDQPSWVNVPRALSMDIPVGSSWSAACWCPDNGRIIVGNVKSDDNAVFEIEIPVDVDDVWNVTRVPLPAGQSIQWAPSTTYKKWSYNTYVRAVVYMPYASRSDDDTVYVYRPRGT